MAGGVIDVTNRDLMGMRYSRCSLLHKLLMRLDRLDTLTFLIRYSRRAPISNLAADQKLLPLFQSNEDRTRPTQEDLLHIPPVPELLHEPLWQVVDSVLLYP